MDARSGNRDPTRRQRWHRGADWQTGLGPDVPRQSGPCLGAEHHTLPAAHRLPDLMRRLEPHPHPDPAGVDRASRLCTDRAGGGQRAPRLCPHAPSGGGGVMSLYRLARERAAAGRPVKVGLIGAGKFGSMFLNQVPTITGVEIAVIADLDPDRARHACRTVGWDAARIARTRFVASGTEACADPEVEVVVEATGSPPAGIDHARAAMAAGKHIVMVNVEADALAGPLLAEEARARGTVYSLAYGDQPALTCELIDWARACGFEVVAAGKGTKYLPAYHAVTPDDVWAHYGLTPDEAKRGGMNPQMFNSFLDGTKSAIEMAAIANASGLAVPEDGLGFPPCGVDDLPEVLRPKSAGGVLEQDGMVEVVSSLERDGRPVFRDLRWGVYVVLKAPNDYARAC